METRIALAGNPNSGKTTLFNSLTGSNQFVGNWPGVTVEKKEGKLRKHSNVTVTDLPGIYSLSPYTLEEVVARNYLVGESPDVILNIIDGTNLERNLYLTTQLMELGIPIVIAINMIDLVRKKGDTINIQELSRQLGCPVVEISALKGIGVREAAATAIEAAEKGSLIPLHTFSGPVEHTIAHIEEAAVHDLPEARQRWYAIKLFERDEKVLEEMNLPEAVMAHIEQDVEAIEKEMDDDSESIITNERYIYIGEVIKACCRRKSMHELSSTDRIDRIVTSRWLGLPIFVAVMFLVYYIAMATVGAAATDWANDKLFGEYVPGLVESGLTTLGCAPWLKGLILDGIVAGVGAVLGFVPQMLVLFFLLAFLEGCGYMSRIAFVLDRIFRKLGLSGKSFIPMLVGVGCGVPGVMASRTIENERDRRMTIMTTTFIPCGAKIPFIALIAGAIFGGQAWVAVSAYFVGMGAIIISGIMLKKTRMFSGEPAPFVMELPAYHLPPLKNVLRSTWERGWSFIKKAGTIVVLSTIFIWFTSFFGFTEEGFRMLSEDELNLSILAGIGNAISWIFIPLGWGDWQAVVASITGLVAKENIVSTMSILYGAEGGLWHALAQEFTAVTGYSFLVFNLLCAPCFAAIGAIKREMNNGKWTWFAIGYQTAFAYVIALMITQFGKLFTGNVALTSIPDILGLAAAVCCLGVIIYMLARPYKEATHRISIKGGV